MKAESSPAHTRSHPLTRAPPGAVAGALAAGHDSARLKAGSIQTSPLFATRPPTTPSSSPQTLVLKTQRARACLRLFGERGFFLSPGEVLSQEQGKGWTRPQSSGQEGEGAGPFLSVRVSRAPRWSGSVSSAPWIQRDVSGVVATFILACSSPGGRKQQHRCQRPGAHLLPTSPLGLCGQRPLPMGAAPTLSLDPERPRPKASQGL